MLLESPHSCLSMNVKCLCTLSTSKLDLTLCPRPSRFISLFSSLHLSQILIRLVITFMCILSLIYAIGASQIFFTRGAPTL